MNELLKKIILIFLLILVFPTGVFSYNSEDFLKIEEQLNMIYISIAESETDNERLEKNSLLHKLFFNTLQKPESFDYHFDSLEEISVLKSPDERLRIITWFVPLNNGHFEYFGFIQAKDYSLDSIKIYELRHTDDLAFDEVYEKFSNNKWYGAYYYDIIHNQLNGNDFYTLLGWRRKNPLISQRIIEPLVFDSDFKPVFGQNNFKYNNNNELRIIFNYSAKVTMALAYEQVIRSEGLRGRSRHDFIIFDRIQPRDDYLQGHYQFYKPVAGIFDSFVFEDGYWVLQKDIDARNP